MRNCLFLLLVTLSTSVHSSEPATEFMKGDDGKLQGWSFSGDGAGALDTEVLYEGQPSVRLDRVGDPSDDLSFVLRRIPLNFDAEIIELRAKLKAKETAPWAGVNVMLRQDVAGQAIEFTNSQPFVTGTDTGWQAVRISQRVNPNTETLVFGSVLTGPGEAWVSDIQLWVDGEHVTQLPEGGESLNGSSGSSLGDIESMDIAWSDLDEVIIQDLTAFTQVWGFLKYFHPEVAQGTYDWDVVFIESTHSLIAGSSLTSVLTQLLRKVGVPEHSDGELVAHDEQVIEKTTPDWFLSHEAYDSEITEALQAIYANRSSFGESAYAFTDGMGLPVFAREKRHVANHLEYELRLLAVARLWNVLEYWFPYRQTLSIDWRVGLPGLIERAVQEQTHEEFRQVVQGMLAQLDDGHGFLSQSVFQQGACYLPFTVRYIDDQFVVAKLHQLLPEHDVQLGDTLVGIDGERFDKLVAQWFSLYPASNDSTAYYDLANDLLARQCDEPTNVTLSRTDSEHQVEFTEYGHSNRTGHTLPGDTVQLLAGNITYLKVTGVDFDAVDEAVEQARDTGKLIIDVRGYPSEFIVYDLGGQLTEKSLPFARMASASPTAPGIVTMHEYTLSLEPQNGAELEGIVILVDETSVSQSEFTVMAWRELANVTVVGSTTAGAVGNARRVPLPDGTEAIFAGSNIFDGEKLNI